MELEKYSTILRQTPKGSTPLIINLFLTHYAIHRSAIFHNAASLMSTGHCMALPQKSKNAVTLIQITTSSQGTFSENWDQIMTNLLTESATKDGFTNSAFSTRITPIFWTTKRPEKEFPEELEFKMMISQETEFGSTSGHSLIRRNSIQKSHFKCQNTVFQLRNVKQTWRSCSRNPCKRTSSWSLRKSSLKKEKKPWGKNDSVENWKSLIWPI